MLVTDRRRCRGRDLVALVVEAVRGGVGAVLLRERDLDPGPFAELAQRLAGAVPSGTLLSIHSRAEVARALGAGLHLAEAGPAPPGDVGWHGRSVHDADAVGRACREGATYLVAGTIYATAGKHGVPGIGPEGLRSMCEAAGTVPVFAIGGIDARRVEEALAAGAHGVAVVGAILEADDPRSAARALALALH